jgi:hypothetical protein
VGRRDTRRASASAPATTPRRPAGLGYHRAVSTRLTPDQIGSRDLLRQLSDQQVAPRAAAIDSSGELQWDLARLLAAHDVLIQRLIVARDLLASLS